MLGTVHTVVEDRFYNLSRLDREWEKKNFLLPLENGGIERLSDLAEVTQESCGRPEN